MTASRARVLFLSGVFCLWTAAAFAQAPAAPGADTQAAALTKVFNLAMEAFQAANYSTAAANLQKVIAQAGPGSKLEPVYFTLGAAYFNLADYPNAIATLKTYVQKFPGGARTLDAIYSIGQASLLNKDDAGAAAAFSQLENVPRYRDRALLYEATAYKEEGAIDQAIGALERLITPEIRSTVAMNGAMMLAGMYVDKEEPDKAEALMNQIFSKVQLVENMVRLNALAASLGDRLLESRHEEAALAAYHRVQSRAVVIAFQTSKVTALERMVQQNVAAMRANPREIMSLVADNNLIQAELRKAKTMRDEALKMPDFEPGLLLRQGRAWYDWDKKWESIVVFNRLVTRFPDAKVREAALFSLLTAYADVNQVERARDICETYLKEFPQGKYADTVGYLLGATALQANDLDQATTYFGRALSTQTNSSYREQMRFLLGNAELQQGKYDDAIKDYKQYLTDFPNGQFVEEATYRIDVALVFSGKYQEAMSQLDDYLSRYPSGKFAPDAKYRRMVCEYAAQQYPQVISEAQEWQKNYPDNAMRAEVLSLLGDAQEAQGDLAAAIPDYIESWKNAKTDEVMNYSLFEAAKDLQKLGKWSDLADMFQEFIKDKPGNSSVVAAMYWIGKALSHEGKTAEAKQLLVEQLQNYINDPRREAVEQLLQQLAQLCSHRPRPAPGSLPASSPIPIALDSAQEHPASSPQPVIAVTATPPPYDAVAELDRQLAPLSKNTSATARARILYTKAELATLLRKHGEHDRLIQEIAHGFKPEDLSPLLLAQSGDALLAVSATSQAVKFYSQLKEFYPNSLYLDYAYVGLGEVAFGKKDYPDALKLFSYAADKLAGAKVKDATIGEAKTHLEMGDYDDARKLYEEIAGVREWRGESTAYAVYQLGDIQARQGHWAEAIAYYQRVFVLYQRYLPWVAKAYIASARSFDKLGKRPEAIAHLQEMLRNDKLQSFPEINEARQMLGQWGASA